MGNHRKSMPLAMLITSLVTCQGEKLSAAHMIDRAGPFTGLHFYFLKGRVCVKASIPHMAAMNHHWSRIRHGTPRA